MKKVKMDQSCLTLCNPMDYTVHEILQAGVLEWVAIPFSRGISPTQGLNPGLPHCRWILYLLSHKGSPRILEWVAFPFPEDLPKPGIEPRSPALQVDSLPTEPWGKPKVTQASHKKLGWEKKKKKFLLPNNVRNVQEDIASTKQEKNAMKKE